ncbi:hypothetical protein EJ08DRAFT_70532 [Tothia fuscella]|uniref:CID domain-containing protein n=1 Tax=Tothia fuscella TaxID=1048955 RepID=A0A9P4NEV3_9PEZI|nr:hypothetical protein EJ08DRAFT_70532 [Tothia fuscella]
MMSYPNEAAEEVATAFREALDDLQRNDQYEIDNLTVIAKESTEHAQSICVELENHIKKTRPAFKLPALYLLDSLVKNVGTPYTVYLGRNLYKTFFDAYTVVDPNTRKAMEELFQSWKQPVPLSRDPRPVFPVEITASMDSSLEKMRSINLRAEQEKEQARLQKMRMAQLPARLGNMPPRQTPTPTGSYGYKAPPIIGQNSNPNSGEIAAMMNSYQQPSTPNNYQQALRSPGAFPPPSRQGAPFQPYPSQPHPPQQYPPQQHTPQQHPASTAPAFSYSGPPPATMSHQARLDKLRADVQGLLDRTNAFLVHNPYDGEKKDLLANLGKLKQLLDGGQLSLASIQSTEVVVANLALKLPSHPPAPVYPPASAPPQLPQMSPALLAMLSGQTPQPTPPQSQPPQPYSYPPPPSVAPTPQYAPPPLPQSGPPVSIAQMMAMIRASTPTLQPASPATALAPAAPNLLLEQLRASGLLGGMPSANTNSATVTPVLTPTLNFSELAQPQPVHEVKIDSASLKIRRPQVIGRLYGDRPDQCRQCGMRFPGIEAGKKAKGNHIDWHFKTNSRVADSTKSAVNRSWYIDEREWIDYREDVGGINGKSEEEINAMAKANGTSRVEPKEQFVPVPSDLAQANRPCSICQEKFEQEWNVELEQPVWKDAIKVGNKYYHATCYAEVTKGNAAARAAAVAATGLGGGIGSARGSARSTPESSVLGKRTFDHFKLDTHDS